MDCEDGDMSIKESWKRMPQPKKVLLIINPIAGKRKMRSKIMDVLDAFSKNQYLTATLTTTARGTLQNT